MEKWKNIEFQGVPFVVSNLGNFKIAERECEYTRVRNGKKQTIKKCIPETTYTPQIHHTGYISIELRFNGKRVRTLAHRLVALAHCDGYEDGLCVNHINGIKSDNQAENLEWVSLARNTQHAWQTGLADLNGEKQPTHKLTTRQVVYIRRLLDKSHSRNRHCNDCPVPG